MVLIEPALGPGYGVLPFKTPRLAPEVLSARRKDRWASRDEARKHLLKSPYYAAFDSRVFEKVMKYQLRDNVLRTEDLSSSLAVAAASDAAKFPSTTATHVPLTTPKTMETDTWLRPSPPLPGFPKGPDYATRTPESNFVAGFYRGEAAQFHASVPHIYPTTLYVWGTESPVTTPQRREMYMREKGTGLGGSGGVKTGKVKEVWVQGARHAAALEKPEKVARAVAPWLRDEVSKWKEEQEKRKGEPPFEVEKVNQGYLDRIAKL